MSATSLPRLPADFKPVELRGQRVLVLGLGSFGGGLGAASHLRREGAEVTVADLRSAEDLAEPIRELEATSHADRPIAYVLGRHPNEQEVAAADWIVASPAVKWSAPPLVIAAKRGIPVESEITLLLRLLPCPWLGITGTNGKSTTTMLASHCLAAEGRRVWSGGNLGGSLLGSWREMRAEDVAVLEISSFQLEHMAELGLGPTVGLVTNVTPDHLDRHGTFEAYAAAKQAILARAKTAVLRRGDPVCERFGDECRQQGTRVLWFGENGAFESGTFLPDESAARLLDERTASFRDEDGRETEVDLARFPLRGAHNRLNLLAAAAAATRFGVPFASGIRAAFGAKPLERRLNEVGRVQEVLFVDDSVSTSPPAVAAALGAFPGRSRLLAGGYDKGIDPAPLIAAILARGPEEGAGGCLKAYLYGAVGPALAARLERAVAQKSMTAGRENDVESECAKWEVFVDLRSAFAAAAREAQPGDTVLFSPGYASYDQFRNFTERGDLFRALVSQIATH